MNLMNVIFPSCSNLVFRGREQVQTLLELLHLAWNCHKHTVGIFRYVCRQFFFIDLLNFLFFLVYNKYFKLEIGFRWWIDMYTFGLLFL